MVSLAGSADLNFKGGDAGEAWLMYDAGRQVACLVGSVRLFQPKSAISTRSNQATDARS